MFYINDLRESRSVAQPETQAAGLLHEPFDATGCQCQQNWVPGVQQ